MVNLFSSQKMNEIEKAFCELSPNVEQDPLYAYIAKIKHYNHHSLKSDLTKLTTKLQEFAKKLNLQFLCEDRNKGTTTQITICLKIFLVDIEVTKKGRIQSVKLSFASDFKHDESADAFLLGLLSKGRLESFYHCLKYLALLDHHTVPPLDFFHCLHALELDIVGVYELEL